MKYAELRIALAGALVVGGLGACSRPASQPRVVGPALGESTAPGPSDPLVPPPDAAGVSEVSARISGTGGAIANPAPARTGDVPAASSPSSMTPPADPGNPATVFVPGVVAAPGQQAPTTTGTAAPINPGPGTAGPNGPGTGNGPATPVAPVTGTRAPVAPPAPPNGGPGAGNAPVAPAPVTPAPQPGVPGTGNAPVAPAPVMPAPQPMQPTSPGSRG
jgi:hypothetical protein